MKIYYYHTRPIASALKEWKEHTHPGHILYGLTHFPKNGIDPVLHPYKHFTSRWKLMWYNLHTILGCKENYDVVYGTSYRGLELLIFLRALGLFRKPIAVWHHQAVPQSKGWLKNLLSRLFYKGIDCMFFFSKALIDDSLKTGKVKEKDMYLIHWGADLDFYDRMRNEAKNKEFISTGKENRDLATLLQAFSHTGLEFDLYTSPANGDQKYEEITNRFQGKNNIHIHIVEGIIPYQLALEVARSKVVVISCLNYPYTVGLTTLVEALALGLPIISTRNTKFEMNLELEQAGMLVDYGDVAGWEKALQYLHDHPEQALKMGENGRKLAETTYNLENYSRELSEVLLKRFNR